MAGGTLQKAFKVDGIRRRAAEATGILTAVLAGPEEVELVGGPPGPRRRFLDLASVQTDPAYLQALQRYQRVLTQRNALLRQARERPLRPGEMAVWDRELAQAGAYLLERREAMLETLRTEGAAAHAALTGQAIPLALEYHSTVGPVMGEGRGAIQERFLTALAESRPRDTALGATTVGPHRDDLRFLSREVDLGVYGSRGQQRTLALSLVLAQAAYMRRRSGEEPVLLLDDSLSELDAPRRERLTEICSPPGRQVLLTTADPGLVPPVARGRASAFRVREGQVTAEPL